MGVPSKACDRDSRDECVRTDRCIFCDQRLALALHSDLFGPCLNIHGFSSRIVNRILVFSFTKT